MPETAQNDPAKSGDQPELKAYSLPKEKILEQLNTKDSGLTEEEATNRLGKYGLNRLTPKKKISPLQMFIGQFKNTLTLILIGAAFLILMIYFLGDKEQSDLIEAGLILAIVLMIAIMGFVQEFKAEKSIEALKKLLAFKAKVRRDGVERELDVTNLVPGDIVILEEGTKVPADIRLLEVFSLSANEASLTGESTTASKFAHEIEGEKQINDQKNMVFSGTAVTSGRAVGVVIATGDHTEIGKIAGYVAEADDDETPIQKRLNQIGKSLGYIILGICGIVFVFIMFFAADYAGQSLIQRIVHSFIAAVALAVAAIPEGLPAVVTIALALGTRRMLARNALVRKLNSIETLGSTDVICSDKTGTLTKGEMTVTEIYFDKKTYDVSGTGYEKTGKFEVKGSEADTSPLKQILQVGLDCNNASFSAEGNVLGDPTEAALIISAAKAGISQKSERVMEIPFSSERRMMSVVVKSDGKYFLYSKGATEMLINKCNLSEEDKKDVLAKTHEMSTKALRTLAFGCKEISEADYKGNFESPEKLEEGLTLLGLQGMIDPPRTEVKPLIDTCRQSGIRVIMITGDHAATAKAVAGEIGIEGDAVTGEELDKLSDEELKNLVEKTNIYARVNPSFKMKIVDILKKDGHVVAMTGDGVNDAPALKKSDIGIAMGITGTDVAKEASDMVLMDDHFSTIVYAIEEGRGIFHNIRKFVNYLLACNIAEVLVVFFAVMFFKELPITATMLLWINVVTDGIPATALGLDPAEKGIMRYSPKAFQTDIVPKRLWVDMFIFGCLMTISVLILYKIDLPKSLEEAKGAVFTALVVFEMMKIFIIRSGYKTSVFSNKWLIISIASTLLIQVAIVYTPFLSTLFEIKNIQLFDWAYILVSCAVIWTLYKLIVGFLDRINFMTGEKKLTSTEPAAVGVNNV